MNIFKRIFGRGRDKKKQAVRFEWKFGLPKLKQPRPRKPMPLEVSITNEQKIKATLSPVSDTGRPAQLDGNPRWEILSGNSTLDVAPDGRSAYLISSDTPGDTLFCVKADADLGEGVEELMDTINLKVTGAMAKNLGLMLGTPEAK